MAERNLKAWQAAGLIDGATAARIRAYEAEHTRPYALWAVVSLASLSIGLGIISLVAANWAMLSPMLRLSLHGILLAALALVIATIADTGNSRSRPKVAPALLDATLLVFALLGLAFLGHLGQIYQISAPTWQSVALWLLLFAPVLLALGQGWPSAILLVGGSITLAWLRLDDPVGLTHSNPAIISPIIILRSAECAAPALFLPLATWRFAKAPSSSRANFWHNIATLAQTYVVLATSLLVITGSFDAWHDNDPTSTIRTALLAISATLALAAFLQWRLEPLAQSNPLPTATPSAPYASLLSLSALAATAIYPLSGRPLASGLLFLALWAGIAACALFSSHRSLYQSATAIFALRLIILSFEATGGLLLSGLGLILGGILILVIAWAAWRLSRAFAPQSRDTAHS